MGTIDKNVKLCNGWSCPIRITCLRFRRFEQWCAKEIKFCGLIIADYNKGISKCKNFIPTTE